MATKFGEKSGNIIVSNTKAVDRASEFLSQTQAGYTTECARIPLWSPMWNLAAHHGNDKRLLKSHGIDDFSVSQLGSKMRR